MNRIESERRKVTGPVRRAMHGCRAAAFLLAAFVLATALGCSPASPTMEELGQLVYDPSQVPGHDRPYKLPHGLDEAKSADQGESDSPPAGAPAEPAAKPAE